MGRKSFTAEQIIFKLREVEVLVGHSPMIIYNFVKALGIHS
jgi:hypothetical protein